MKKFPILLFLLFWTYQLNLIAQSNICTGNLGDNIFESGDFGTGQVNIPQKPAGLISTYNYVFSGPPFDGNFTITNNTGAWSNLYQTWLATGDNSNDPNGYFMVVNADFSPGIFYEQTIEGLCENTLYVFSADILNIVRTGTPDHTLPNVSFLLDDVEQFTTGGIQQNESWNTYGFTFTTGPEVTSMKLGLRNNAPGGSGNDLGIDNISFRACGPLAEILPKDIANICEDGDPIAINATVDGDQFGAGAFQWQQSFDEGLTWEDLDLANDNTIQHTEKSAGFYYYRYLLANSTENLSNSKCRINSNVKIVQVVPKLWDIEKEICTGLSFSVGTNNYDQTGIYTDSLISSLGCDSIVTLDLTVVDDGPIVPIILSTDPICTGTNSGIIDIPTIRNINPPYEIQLDEKTSSSLVRFVELGADAYEIFIEDAIGCTFDTIINLVDPELFSIELGADRIIDLGDSIAINPTTNYPINEFQWSPNQAERCETDCLTQSFLPTVSGTYTLNAISDLGCLAVDSIQVLVNPIRKVFLPNVFSPNNDGINDFFTIHANSPNVQNISDIAIFDRWGNQVFQQNNLDNLDNSNLWDGTYRGQVVTRGTYIYMATVLFLDGQEEVIRGGVSVVY